MPHAENLIPNSERTREELQENGRKGGFASGVSKRQGKSLREALAILMALPVQDKRKLSKLVNGGVDSENADNMMLLALTAFEKATRGDPRWGKMLFDVLDKESGGGTTAGLCGDPLNAMSPAFYDSYIAAKTGKITELVEKGGRGSAKSSFISLALQGQGRRNS